MDRVWSLALRVVFLALLASSPLVLAGAAFAQEPTANAENCTNPTWGYLWHIDDEYGTVNICAYSVDVWFMTPSGQTVRHTVAAGGTFRTGLKMPAFDRKRGWIATTCQAGYSPHPEVSKANWDAIVKEQYNCQKPASQ
jgi:hypothetical protein